MTGLEPVTSSAVGVGVRACHRGRGSPHPSDRHRGQLAVVALADEQPSVRLDSELLNVGVEKGEQRGGQGTTRTYPRARCLSGRWSRWSGSFQAKNGRRDAGELIATVDPHLLAARDFRTGIWVKLRFDACTRVL